MIQQAKTPGDIVSQSIDDASAMTGSSEGTSTADRIALALALSVAILILVVVGLTCRSTAQPMPAAAYVAMSSYVDLPVSEPDGRGPTITWKD